MPAFIRTSFRLFSKLYNWPYNIVPGFGVFTLPPELVDGTAYVMFCHEDRQCVKGVHSDVYMEKTSVFSIKLHDVTGQVTVRVTL